MHTPAVQRSAAQRGAARWIYLVKAEMHPFTVRKAGSHVTQHIREHLIPAYLAHIIVTTVSVSQSGVPAHQHIAR
jgi:hypothetical protein